MKKSLYIFLLLAFSNLGLSAQIFCEAYFNYQTDPNSSTVYYVDGSEVSGQVIGYSWDFGFNQIVNEQNPVITYNGPGNYYACLSIFTTDSCTSTYCDSLSIGGTNPVDDCEAYIDFENDGNTYFFYGNGEGVPNFTYEWNFYNGNISTDQNPIQTYPAAGVYDVTLTITDAVGCSAEQTITIFADSTGTGGGDGCASVSSGASPYGEDDPIFQEVIAEDSWCCTNGWDNLCQEAYDDILNGTGGGDSTGVCNPNFDYSDWLNPVNNVYIVNLFPEDPNQELLWEVENGIEVLEFNGGYSFETSNPGIYSVCLIELECGNMVCQDIELGNEPECSAEFEFEVSNEVPYFLGMYTWNPADVYNWLIIGPNGVDSLTTTNDFVEIPNPIAGTYEVCLYVQSGDCFDEFCNAIVLGNGQEDCNAQFGVEYWQDAATGLYNVDLYPFNFNQEIEWNVDVSINPNGVYSFQAEPGTYEICATAFTAICQDSYCETIVIEGNTGNDCQADFVTEYWTDSIATNLYFNALFDAEIYNWTVFGPNFVDTLMNAGPVINNYVVFEPGEYVVCLGVISGNCFDEECQTIIVEGGNTGEDDCSAEFGVEYYLNPNSGLYTIDVYPLTDLNQELDLAGLPFELTENGYYTVEVEAAVYDICLTAFTATCQDENCQTIILEEPGTEVCASILNQTSPYGEDDAYFQQVIAQDTYCCDVAWDGICQSQYDDLSGGNGGWVDSLGCMTIANGSSPYGEDDPIFQQVIEQDPWCCNNGWDALCQCQYDELSGVSVGDNGEGNSICGDVFGGSPDISQELSGTVYLIAFDPVNLTLTALQTYDFEAGNPNFCFELSDNDLEQQSILYLKAALNADSPYYENLLPTYYDGALLWYNANPVAPGDGYTIYLSPGINPGGPGFIGGELIDGPGKTATAAQGVPVLLLNTDRTPVAYVMTDEDGAYDFSGLPYGTYQLIPDIWGQRIDPIIVTISEDTDSVTDTQIEVEALETTGLLDINTSAQAIAVYPNPTKSNYQFRLESDQAQKAEIVLYNILGETMQSNKIQLHSGVNTIQQNTGNQAAGVYFVEITLENGMRYTSKVIKE